VQALDFGHGVWGLDFRVTGFGVWISVTGFGVWGLDFGHEICKLLKSVTEKRDSKKCLSLSVAICDRKRANRIMLYITIIIIYFDVIYYKNITFIIILYYRSDVSLMSIVKLNTERDLSVT